MIEIEPQDRATIQKAAEALHIDRKTIYRWIDKGLISKIKDGSKTYVSLEEVKALRDKGGPQDATKYEAESGKNPYLVTLERTHYEGLLIKLGQFEAERRYLLEYKEQTEAKDKALLEAMAEIEAKNKEIDELKVSMERLKKPWWKRWLRK